MFKTYHLYSLIAGILYGWLVVSSPEINSFSLSVLVFDSLLKGALFAFLLWLPALHSEEALLFSALGALISSVIIGGMDGASAVVVVALGPNVIAGYIIGNHIDLFNRAPIKSYGLGTFMLALALLYFCAFIDSFLLLLAESGQTASAFFSSLLNEGRQLIQQSQEMARAIMPELAALMPADQTTMLTDSSILANDLFIARFFALPFGLAALLALLSILLVRFLAPHIGLGAGLNLSFITMQIPGRFLIPGLMALSLLVSQGQSALAFTMTPLMVSLTTIYVIHGFSTLHFIVKNHKIGGIILFFSYLLVFFVPFFSLLPLFLGISEQLFQLKTKNITI